MRTAFIVVGVLVVVSWVVVVTAAVVARRRLRRRLEVVPGVTSSAPLVWVWSVSGPARRHRRLRATGAGAPALPPGGEVTPGIDELIVAFHQRVQRLDRELARLRHVPRADRAPALRRVDEELTTLRPLAERLTRLRPAGDPDVDDLEVRLDALESAHEELRALERRVRGELPEGDPD